MRNVANGIVPKRHTHTHTRTTIIHLECRSVHCVTRCVDKVTAIDYILCEEIALFACQRLALDTTLLRPINSCDCKSSSKPFKVNNQWNFQTKITSHKCIADMTNLIDFMWPISGDILWFKWNGQQVQTLQSHARYQCSMHFIYNARCQWNSDVNVLLPFEGLILEEAKHKMKRERHTCYECAKRWKNPNMRSARWMNMKCIQWVEKKKWAASRSRVDYSITNIEQWDIKGKPFVHVRSVKAEPFLFLTPSIAYVERRVTVYYRLCLCVCVCRFFVQIA